MFKENEEFEKIIYDFNDSYLWRINIKNEEEKGTWQLTKQVMDN